MRAARGRGSHATAMVSFWRAAGVLKGIATGIEGEQEHRCRGGLSLNQPEPTAHVARGGRRAGSGHDGAKEREDAKTHAHTEISRCHRIARVQVDCELGRPLGPPKTDRGLRTRCCTYCSSACFPLGRHPLVGCRRRQAHIVFDSRRIAIAHFRRFQCPRPTS